MKVGSGEAERFVDRPPPAVDLVLLYGPDAGLAAERARRLAGRVVDDLADPFRVTDLDGPALESSPGRLAEEALALTLMGGRRLVRVRQAGDRLTAACKEVLAAPAAAFVVLEAGELPGRSSLRQLCEASPRAAAIGCYPDTDKALPAVLRGLLQAAGLELTPDAFALLAARLGGDRALTRAEIDKLALYMADRPGTRATLDDVAAVVGDSSTLDTDRLIAAVVANNQAALELSLDRLLAEAADPGRLVRAVARTLLQALRTKAELARGKPPQAALAGLFFERRTTMERLLRRPAADLIAALGALQEAETRCRLAAADTAALVARRALAAEAARVRG